MCLAVPMQILSIDEFQCRCSARGIERDVSLYMLQDESLEPGDYVLVHVGYALQKVDADEATATLELFDELAAADA